MKYLLELLAVIRITPLGLVPVVLDTWLVLCPVDDSVTCEAEVGVVESKVVVCCVEDEVECAISNN